MSGYTVGIGTMMELTDGEVMAQGGGVSNLNNQEELPTDRWFKLTPDSTAGYVGATWDAAPTMVRALVLFWIKPSH